ncbi:MAG: GHMP kinase [Bacteroidia bacterium]|nr:GHMP kinase [Bacteroidia bacterium]NND11099.1 GHMP kinase [Flavobacteriaceae bacterium]NNK28041.1 GHMP kinase [Flavobacteriaceae bacterium]
MHYFYSHGKLLLTSEYVVLDGALSLSLPTKKGQSLTIEALSEPLIDWTSLDDEGNVWFEQTFSMDQIISVSGLNHDYPRSIGKNILDTLIGLLGKAKSLNPSFLSQRHGFKVTTTLEFPRDWGLGSSSTLINNIADWAQLDAFELLESTFKGSGYDIACARSNGPITYQLNGKKRITKEVSFQPIFSKNLFFVHLNKKQDSREGILSYRTKGKVHTGTINELSDITTQILKCNSLSDFENLLIRHESIISNLIDEVPIKNRVFNDYNGAIKSLGAWGGDFILATSRNDPSEYFQSKGFHTIIPYGEMILK